MRIVVGWGLAGCLGLLGGAAFAQAGGSAGPSSPSAAAPETVVFEGVVYDDRDDDGVRDRGEPGVAGVGISDGLRLVRTGRDGRYRLTTAPGRTVFAIKPAEWSFRARADGTPAFWAHAPRSEAQRRETPTPKYGGIVASAASSGSKIAFEIALRRNIDRAPGLDVLIFGDPQVKSRADVGYYARDIIDGVLAETPAPAARLGVSLGDIADDVLSLYPALNAETRRLRTPWLHAPGNHDMDVDVARDEDALLSFRNVFGPDTYAWEEREAIFVVLDDVIFRPGQKPAYVGGFREDQFAFLEAYLADAPKDRLLVLSMHIPLFESEGRDTFRDADRERLFGLLRAFPQRLILSAHNHTQQHYFHDARTGWREATPLHEYNVGATCGAYWSGAKDARGVPDTTMADGTPNGYARMRVDANGTYALTWRVAGVESWTQASSNPQAGGAHEMYLYAPKALRRGAYPGWAVYANVYMGRADTRVEYRVDDGPWKAMTRARRFDPRLLLENARDDTAEALRGYDRSPEPEPSEHLWRGALPTDLAVGAHRVEVRAFDAWQGEQRASIEYRLLEPEH
ncbi:MAG: calcineurin phosphoesterase [Lysobacter sp.]|nr:MAG: calcineurin phosphoesterase [Lysobacter sp.]